MKENIKQENKLDIVAGRNPVMEALGGNRTVERVFVAKGCEGSISKIVALAKEKGIVVSFVPKEKIDSMANAIKHQGVVAKVSDYKYSVLEDIMNKSKEYEEEPFIIILDEITDPHNFGAIIRTAECVGAHGVIIPKRRSCLLNQTVALTSAGAIEKMPIVQVTNISQTIINLKEKGLWIAAADMDGESCFTTNLTGPIGLVIGNEGKGISRLVKKNCDFIVSIPIKGSISSLNASNAAAVLMYAVRQQREKK